LNGRSQADRNSTKRSTAPHEGVGCAGPCAPKTRGKPLDLPPAVARACDWLFLAVALDQLQEIIIAPIAVRIEPGDQATAVP
jgi:hypothetical protein